MKVELKFATICLLAASLVWPAASFGQETAKQEKQETSDAKQEQDEKEEEEELVYELDEDASLKDATNLIESLKAYRPKDRTSARKHAMSMRQAMPKLYAFIIEKSESDMETDSDVYFEAKRFVIQTGLRRNLTPEKAQETLSELKSFLKDRELNAQDGSLAMMACYYLNNAGGDFPEGFKGSTCKELAALLNKAEGKGLERSAKMIEGLGRRANLVGQELKLTGTTFDGESFNIEDLKGKVVLVDFWATWCGPCIAEHPNIVKNYEKYHDKGFEVVGLSIDRSRKALEKFMEDHESKWIVLHDEGGVNEATTYYGVVGIPSMFLVGKDGKVISTTARGQKLTDLLAEIFGDDAEDEESDDEDDGDGK